MVLEVRPRTALLVSNTYSVRCRISVYGLPVLASEDTPREFYHRNCTTCLGVLSWIRSHSVSKGDGDVVHFVTPDHQAYGCFMKEEMSQYYHTMSTICDTTLDLSRQQQCLMPVAEYVFVALFSVLSPLLSLLLSAFAGLRSPGSHTFWEMRNKTERGVGVYMKGVVVVDVNLHSRAQTV
ncbi:hypothetical protein PROFUN_01228 [Planoprotostelium fungivorum]|uniref:Uncharacterized protein n=1 Tax=Planoprotostelium fungivorum TaxID=1890364 RepID=A0A2P6NZG5_9EUKA|nr:hypothetical protein PROFUN_01228 [Planoprotostelium fungivorum]